MYKKKIFVSFHHKENQAHAQRIRSIIKNCNYDDISVNNGTKIENETSKSDEQIRVEIRDKFLRNVDVTVVIVGMDSIHRKHIDWEIRSTLHKFEHHKNAGIVVVNVLENGDTWILDKELMRIHDEDSIIPRYWPEEINLPWLPERLRNSISNNYDQKLCEQGIYNHAIFPILSYKRIINKPSILKIAIEHAISYKKQNEGKWDTNSKMRRNNNEGLGRSRFNQVPAYELYG